jgi:hypothetical protein
MRNYALIILAFLVMSCSGDDDSCNVDEGSALPVTNILLLSYFSDHLEAGNQIIKSQAEMDILIDQMMAGNVDYSDYFENYPVDFNNQMVIIVIDDFMRQENPPSISVVSAVEFSEEVVVTHTLTGSGLFFEIPWQSFHLVSIPKTDKPIRFVAEDPTVISSL